MPQAKPTFLTSRGQAVGAVTADQMREIDRIAVEETGPSLLQMMEHAGRSAASLALELLAVPTKAARILVLAGSGGNGGGGIAAARHLAGRVGHVSLGLVAPDRLGEAAALQLATYRHTPGSLDPSGREAWEESPFDLILDAMIGYGLRDAPRDRVSEAISRTNAAGAVVISLDLPSGIDADTGRAPGASVRADATLTLHLPKAGLIHPGTGALHLADLGIPEEATRRIGVAPPDYGSSFILALEGR